MNSLSQHNAIQKRQTVFERHPVITIVAVLVIVFLGIVFGAEQYFSYKHKISSQSGRCIRLREHQPLSSYDDVPSDDYIRIGDGIDKKKYLLRIDENGFIYPSKIYDHPDLTIVFLGGSTTECRYMEENNRFPFLSGRLIEKKTGNKCNAYNQGVSGNTTMHANDLLLNKIIPMKPDIVVLMEDINDLITLVYEGTYWNANPSRSLITVNSERNGNTPYSLFVNLKNLLVPNLYLQLLQVVDLAGFKGEKTDEFGHIRGKKLVIDENDISRQFNNSILTFIGISRIWGIKPVLMTQPNRMKEHEDAFIQKTREKMDSSGLSYQDIAKNYHRFNQNIREIGKTNNLVVIDLDSLIPKEKVYFHDLVHLSDSGSCLAATIIADKVSAMYKDKI
jgi:hypothetical protein